MKRSDLDDEPVAPLVKWVGKTLHILDEGEYCVVCETLDDLWTHELPSTGADSEGLTFTVCKPCLDGDGYRNWLTGEFEKALEADGSMEKGEDGKWRTKAS